MKLNILSNKISWFGKYSGYECLTNYFPSYIKTELTIPKDDFFNKLIGKLKQKIKRWNNIRPSEIFAEIQFFNKLFKASASHILYLESHIHCLEKHHNSANLIGTIHLPFKRWKPENLKRLAFLANAIVLYEEEIPLFSKFIESHRIHYIKHGVDIDFFKPGSKEVVEKNKILFIGHYLRNFNMFYEVYLHLIEDKSRKLEFHFIIPSFFRDLPDVRRLVMLPNVFFHEGLSDEDLLNFYQTSYVLLMPMEDSGANTAIVQAIATGLPIITTNVGGIKSYGGGDIFPIIEQNDVIGMVNLFEKYYKDELLRNQITIQQRKFAVEHLDWKIIVQKHIMVYKSILNK